MKRNRTYSGVYGVGQLLVIRGYPIEDQKCISAANDVIEQKHPEILHRLVYVVWEQSSAS
jgi:hypothetical protein